MSAIFIKPISAANFTSSQSRNLQKPTKIFAKRLDFLKEPGFRNTVSWAIRKRNQNIMTGSDGVLARSSDEGIKAFEQEALMEESVSFVDGGLESTINTLSKWIVSALFSALVLWRHDAEALWAAMGAVLNTILSILLKKVLNQERPISTLRSDPGMPSSHAQSIFYTLTFVSLSMVEWYGMNALTAILSGIFFISSCYLSWLRVSQQLHTLSQVTVGALLGSIFSIFWFWSWHGFILNYFISHLWVRIVIIAGAIGFCVGFLVHVYHTWVMEES